MSNLAAAIILFTSALGYMTGGVMGCVFGLLISSGAVIVLETMSIMDDEDEE